MHEFDAIIVGAGSAGATLAARLSENPSRSVLLLEAGPAFSDISQLPSEILDPSTMRASLPGHPYNWTLTGSLMPDLTVPVPRGRGLGGSSSINGCNFVRGTRRNFAYWVELGNDEWSWDDVLPHYKRSETDHDFTNELHGTSGPIPVHREPLDRHVLCEAFTNACLDYGFAEEADKNAGGEGGIGPLPMNIDDGRRVSTAIAYLLPNSSRSNLEVVGDALVRRVIFESDRAVGVQVDIQNRRQVISGGEIILAAGALRSPQLLMLSGIGPASHLRDIGIEVKLDVGGVGANLTDHPELVALYETRVPTPAVSGRGLAPTALNWASEGNAATDLEVALSVSSVDLGSDGSPGNPFIAVGVMQEESRGTLRLASDRPEDNPILTYNYLSAESDRLRFREACTILQELFSAKPMRELGAHVIGLDAALRAGARELDSWVKARLFLAGHPACTCRMGPASDEGAVVDQRGRVYGVEGLRIADTSIFPYVLSQGPNGSAVMLGERMASFIDGGMRPGRSADVID